MILISITTMRRYGEYRVAVFSFSSAKITAKRLCRRIIHLHICSNNKLYIWQQDSTLTAKINKIVFTLFVNELAKPDMWPVIRVLCFLHHRYRSITLETINIFVLTFCMFICAAGRLFAPCNMMSFTSNCILFKLIEHFVFVILANVRFTNEINHQDCATRCSGVYSMSISQTMAWKGDYMSWFS